MLIPWKVPRQSIFAEASRDRLRSLYSLTLQPNASCLDSGMCRALDAIKACFIRKPSNLAPSGFDVPRFPGSPFTFSSEEGTIWGADRPSRECVETALSTFNTHTHFLAGTVDSLLFAKSILAVPASLPLIRLRYGLNKHDMKLTCAVAIGTWGHAVAHDREPGNFQVTDKIQELLGLDANNIGRVTEDLLSTSEKATLRSVVKKVILPGPEQSNTVWMLDPRQSQANKRTLYIRGGITTKLIAHVTLVGYYGLDLDQAFLLMTSPQDISKNAMQRIAAQISRARLLLAARTFPEPGAWGYSPEDRSWLAD